MEILGIFCFLITIILTFKTASLAREKGRSGFEWFVVACFITPYLSMIILACLGETKEMRIKRILEEEELRKLIQEKNDKLDVTYLPNPAGKTVNDLYKK